MYVSGTIQPWEVRYVTVKYDSWGRQIWWRQEYLDFAKCNALDYSGNVYITGKSFGGFTNYDIVTVKILPSGYAQWTTRYAGPGAGIADDIPSDIAVDSFGNVYVTGSSYITSSKNESATIKYDNSGTILWIDRYCGRDDMYSIKANDLVIDISGNVIVTGFRLIVDISYCTIKSKKQGNHIIGYWRRP